MKDRFKIRFKYHKGNGAVQGIAYRVTFRKNPNAIYSSIIHYKEHEGKLSNHLGETVEFLAPSDYGIVAISVKGKSNKYKNWTIVRFAVWDETNDEYKLKTVPASLLRELEIELPLINTKVETKTKETNGNNKSDFYQVKSGDTLLVISKKFKKNISELMENNNIKDASQIHVGQKIYIGNKKAPEIQIFKPKKPYYLDLDYIVNSGDTISSIAKKFSLSEGDIIKDYKLANGNNLKAGTLLKLINHNARLFYRNEEARIKHALTLKGYPLISYQAEFTRQIGVSIGASVWEYLGSSFELGIAWDQRGNWMLYYTTSAAGNLDKKAVNLHDGAKKKINDELSFSVSGSNVRVNAKHVSELTGAGKSFSNTINMGIYEAGFVNVESKTKDIDTGQTKDLKGRGGVSSFEVGKKSKGDLTPNPKAQKAIGITVPIFILETGKLKKDPSNFK